MKSQLKKFIRIYLAAVGGIVGVILAVAVIVEVFDRLKVEDQVLLQIPEESGEQTERILEISVFESVWNESVTQTYQRLTPMTEGTAYKTTKNLAERVEYTDLDGDTERYTYKTKFRIGDPKLTDEAVTYNYFICKADAEIEAVFSSPLYLSLMAGQADGLSVFDFSSMPETELGTVVHGRYDMLVGVNERYCKHGADCDEFTERHILEECGRSIHCVVEDIYLTEEYPRLASNPDAVGIYREYESSALLISAYDKSNPEKLLAQAEIILDYYSAWIYDGLPVSPQMLDEFGINTPENYGYTTATLHDYWQLEEW